MTALRTQRLVALFLTWAFAVIGFSTGINARVKTDQNKAFVKSNVPIPGTVVNIDTHRLDVPGDVLVTGCAGLAFFSSLFILLHLIFSSPRHTASSSRAKVNTSSKAFSTLEGAVLLFWTTWVAASAASALAIARTKSAIVTATLNGTPLPASFIQQEAQALGQNPAYWAQSSLRLFTIIVWPAVLFGLIATFLSFAASSRSSRVNSMNHESQAMTATGSHHGSEKIDEGKMSSERV